MSEAMARRDVELGGAPEGLDALVVAERLKAQGGVGLLVARDYQRSGNFTQALSFFAKDVEVLVFEVVFLDRTCRAMAQRSSRQSQREFGHSSGLAPSRPGFRAQPRWKRVILCVENHSFGGLLGRQPGQLINPLTNDAGLKKIFEVTQLRVVGVSLLVIKENDCTGGCPRALSEDRQSTLGQFREIQRGERFGGPGTH